MPEQAQYDVCIVGGGAAGIAAAVGARQANASHRILVIESESCLGGAATHRGVVSLCGLFTITDPPRQAVGGIWPELRSRLIAIGGTTRWPEKHRGVFQVVEPESLKLVYDELLSDHKIDVLLHTMVVGAVRERDNVTAVEIQERRGRRTIAAAAFVDCSGDCDLTVYAGAAHRYGNHGTINTGSMATRFGGLADAACKAEEWTAAIQNARAESTDVAAAITKDRSVLLRLPHSRDVVAYLASAECDARDSASLSAAERSCRRQARAYLDILRHLPGHDAMYLVSTGHNFGTRESRHMNAVYQLAEADIKDDVHFDDAIALGAWGLEWHQPAAENWASSFAPVPTPHNVFQIPLRSLRSRDTPNLFAAGRCADADQRAGSSIRVMGTALATGQAAGVAAALWAVDQSQEYEVFARRVVDVLRAHGGLLDAAALEVVQLHDEAL